jgi:hypothetical protein
VSRRWVCPTCRAGVLGPERPRRDDVRRYCLACSAKSGRLVERTAPAAERERAERAGRAAAKRSTKQQREREAKIARATYGGVDLQAEAWRIWRLPAIRETTQQQRLPDIEWRHRRGYHTSGVSQGGRLVITAPDDAPKAIAVLIHELAHEAGHWNGEARGHSREFWRLVRRIAREAYPGITVEPCRDGWQVDQAVAAGIRRWQEERRG